MIELRRWLAPSWGRAWILAVSAPAIWVVWLLLDRSPARVIGLAIMGSWIVAAFRLWFWEHPKKH